ncbi:MAG: amidase domain-containing protein [Oscillospiraceae bacterium]|nr:amidase domain-containing protein [Oscillospiraceae bacterium]
MKKLVSIALICSMLLFSLPGIIKAGNNSRKLCSREEILAEIEDIVALVYKSRDTGCEYRFSDIVGGKLADYLSNRINTHQYSLKIYNNYKENYIIQTELLSEEQNENEWVLTYKIITTYNYVYLKDIETYASDVVEITYNFKRGVMTDFYSPYDYYDIGIRGETGAPLDSFDKEDLEQRQKELRDEIDRVYQQELCVLPKKKKTPTRISGYLNSANIVLYARTNFHLNQPDSGDGVVPYFDFSEIPGNYDCTNFVSHCLLAGGANVYDTGGSGICSTGWYFRNDANRSSSWSGVTNLYEYLVNNTHSTAPSGVSALYTTNPNYWSTGDVLQLKFFGSSSYGHSTIITTKQYSYDGERAYALVTGRTSDNAANDNKPVSEWPTATKRTIFVYNY